MSASEHVHMCLLIERSEVEMRCLSLPFSAFSIEGGSLDDLEMRQCGLCS